MDQSSAGKRPRLQFTLRNFLVLTVGVALGFAPLKLWEFTAAAKPQVALDLQILEVPAGMVPELELTMSASGFIGGQRLADSESLNRKVEILKSKGLKVLASPTLTTLSGRPARFSVGGEVPIALTDESGLTTVEYREVGTSVDITPTLHRNGQISLVLDTELSRIDPQADDEVLTTTPRIYTTSSSAELELKDGGTAVFGGQAFDPENLSARGFLIFVATVRSQTLR